MTLQINQQIKHYQLAVIFSLLFALLGFSYNVWRMEVTEQNTNTRTACFELLLVLSELEQLLYAAHYDNNTIEGNPRKGWVKVGLIVDLSTLTTHEVEQSALQLKNTWSTHWQVIHSEQSSVDAIVLSIEQSRTDIKLLLKELQ